MKRGQLRIVFLGTPQFALPCLEFLLEADENLLCVITKPDALKGRHKELSAPPVKLFARKHNLPVFQPETVKEKVFIGKIAKLKPDLLVVVAFGEILCPEFLKVPSWGGINIHASILPKYRGGAPVNWAIIKGEEKTGVTVMKIEERLDRGGIILQKETEILPDDDALILKEKLSLLGREALRDVLGLIKEDKVAINKQDENQASFAPNLKKEDGEISWSKEAGEIHNLVRGTIPWPGAYTYITFTGRRTNFKIWKTALVDGKNPQGVKPGEITSLSKDGWKVATGKGLILIKEVQASGGKSLAAYDFSLGHGIKPGMKLG